MPRDFSRLPSRVDTQEQLCPEEELRAKIRALTARIAELEQHLLLCQAPESSGDDRFRRIVETANEGIWVMDAEYRSAYANELIGAMLGISLQELFGRCPREFFLEEDLAAYDSRMAQRRQGQSDRYETRLRTCRGEIIWVLISATSMLDPRGVFLGSFAMLTDITQRKAVEAELRATRDAALAASRAKDQFLATISHEIRTPLNGALGMLGLLADTELTPEQRGYLEVARTSGRHLQRLLEDILDIACLDLGRRGAVRHAFPLLESVVATLDVFDTEARAKGLELVLNAAPELPLYVYGDQSRLRQILFNLVGNALKFTDHGRVEVSLAVLPATFGRSGINLYLAVTDTGIGIPDHRLLDILHPFVQAEGGLERRFPGLGLGLSIVVRLVRLLGGTLTVGGEEGQGAEFHLTLPLELGPADG